MSIHSTAILHGLAVLPDREVPDSLLLLEGDRIAYAGPFDAGRIPEGARHVDAAGLMVLPGLIDTHVHGTHGDDVMLHGADGIRRISARFPQYGTTAWLPSTISARHGELMQAIRWCVEAHRAPEDGAEIVGLHVEGPYINIKRKGAQPAEGVRDPNFDEVRELLAAAEGQIRVMTLAPELPGGTELIQLLVRERIIASLGHSDATYEEALVGIEAGATHATHLFNAMPPIHHRDPGLITACLNEPRILAEVIPDGVHLDPHIVRLAIRCKGPERVALITDAFSATGLPEGTHTLGPHQVTVRGPLCTLDNGTIAGSIITMNLAVRNAMEFAGVSLVEAVRMSSLIPARVAGCADRKGSLEAGKDADVTLLDRDFHCQATWTRGLPVYSRTGK
ncbi:MAG: N-acetylglucosamine-6-phosphate deacetylase [Armatimonadetes bacterium]|nr:N-acetylglucosamine-6-phosphate deacetylase [Armatimonadota bacterium]